MANKITYRMTIRSSLLNEVVEESSSKIGRPIEDIESDSITTLSDSLRSDGWVSEDTLSYNENFIRPGLGEVIKDGRRVRTSMLGISSIPASKFIIDDSYSLGKLTGKSVMACSAVDEPSYVKADLFKRHNDSISLYRSFNYVDSELIDESSENFSIINTGSGNKAVFNMEEPIQLAEIKKCKTTLSEIDIYSLCVNYTKHLPLLMDEDSFLDLCDYHTIESLGHNGWDIAGKEISIKSKIFPIAQYAVVVAKLENGKVPVPVNLESGINSKDGIVTIDGSFHSSVKTLGDVEGFYIYYMCLPLVSFGSDDMLMKTSDVSNVSLAKIDVDTRDKYGNVEISHRLLSITRGLEDTYTDVEIKVPLSKKLIFIEPSDPIVINGSTYSSSNPLYLNNKGRFKISIGAPKVVQDLCQRADFISDSKIQLSGDLFSDIAAVYGMFKQGPLTRMTLMSSISGKIKEDKDGVTVEALGYGEGLFGLGKFSEGKLSSNGSSINFGVSNSVQKYDFNSRVVVNVKPEVDGYEFIMPSWIDPKTIRITELKSRSTSILSDWKYIQPDIIILDKDKTHPSSTYSISYKSVASPYVPLMDLNNNTIDIEVNTPLKNVYGEFVSLYVVSSKKMDMKIGYINELGGKTYFKDNININFLIDRKFMDKIITGHKSILF